MGTRCGRLRTRSAPRAVPWRRRPTWTTPPPPPLASGLADPNRLSVGLVLKVPLPGKEHVVSAGETLRDIALQEKVDLGSLVDFNQLDDPELIRVGQVVLVPVPATQPTAAPVAPS